MLLQLLPDLVDAIPLSLSSAGRLRCVCKRLNRSTLDTRAALLELFSETPGIDSMSTEALEAAAKRFFADTPPIRDTTIEQSILHIGYMKQVIQAREPTPLWAIVGVDDMQVLYDVEFRPQPPPNEEFILHLFRTRSLLIQTKRGRDAILMRIALWSTSTNDHPNFFFAIAERIRNRRIIADDGSVTI